MNTRRGRFLVVHGLILAVLSPCLAWAGDFDLSERRLIAGLREYDNRVIESLIALDGHNDVVRRAAENPDAVLADQSVESGIRAAILELAAYPGLLSIAAEAGPQTAHLAELRAHSAAGVSDRLARYHKDYEAATRAAAGQWQRLLDHDAVALGEYRSLLNEYCEAQRRRFSDFPFVVVRSRAYYLACPPDESILAFAAQRGVSEALGRVFDRWAEDNSPAAIDEQILENGEDVRSPNPDDLLAYLPESRRADMWASAASGESELVGLMPVILQPEGDQPIEARRAKIAAETARLWMSPSPSNERPAVASANDAPYGDFEDTPEITSREMSRDPREERDPRTDYAPQYEDDPGDDDAEISSLHSEPWTPYTELVPDDRGSSYGYPDRSYGDSDYGYREYVDYGGDGWYSGGYVDVGPSVYYSRGYRYYNSYSCGVPTYYGCAPVAACPPVVVWQRSSPLFVRDHSSHGRVSISIGGSRHDRHNEWGRSEQFPERRWQGEPARFGRGRDSSERANIESSQDSLRRRPSSVATVPNNPGVVSPHDRYRSASENLANRLNEMRDRAGRNMREISRRAAANTPAGRPAVPANNGKPTIRRGPGAPAGSPAIQQGGTRQRVTPSVPAGTPAAPRGAPAIRSTGRPSVQPGANSRSGARPPIQRIQRNNQPAQPRKH